jgi:hypothetical protein
MIDLELAVLNEEELNAAIKEGYIKALGTIGGDFKDYIGTKPEGHDWERMLTIQSNMILKTVEHVMNANNHKLVSTLKKIVGPQRIL